MTSWLKTTLLGASTLLLPLTTQAQVKCDAHCQAQVRVLMGQIQTLQTHLQRQQSAQKAQKPIKKASQRAKARKAKSRAKKYNYAKRQRTPKRYAYRARSGRLTPQQQMLLLQQMQQQQMMFNMMSQAQRNHANMLSENMRIFSARQSCYISGNCRVRVEPNYPY